MRSASALAARLRLTHQQALQPRIPRHDWDLGLLHACNACSGRNRACNRSNRLQRNGFGGVGRFVTLRREHIPPYTRVRACAQVRNALDPPLYIYISLVTGLQQLQGAESPVRARDPAVTVPVTPRAHAVTTLATTGFLLLRLAGPSVTRHLVAFPQQLGCVTAASWS